MGSRGAKFDSKGKKSKPFDVNDLIAQYNNTDFTTKYTADGRLDEWQGYTDGADNAHKLHEIDSIDLSNYNDGYTIYDSPYQKFVFNYGLNAKPYETLSKDDFDAYVQGTGLEVMYRGMQKNASVRLKESKLFHTGRGILGDGVYASTSEIKAGKYKNDYVDGVISRITLSPKARVIDINDVRNGMEKERKKFKNALGYAGQGGTGLYSNKGESQWALKYGYNVIRSNNYIVFLTRDAMIISE